jgi:hypothetical protein
MEMGQKVLFPVKEKSAGVRFSSHNRNSDI